MTSHSNSSPKPSGARRAVFLDRDGVLVRPEVRNGYAYGPMKLEDFELLPGIAGPVERLRRAGFFVLLATNQPGVSRGVLLQSTLDRMHAILCEAAPLDAVYVCPHTDADECGCRKPKPGMLLDAAARHSLDLSRSFFIGDTDRDVNAALAAGVTPVLLDTYYNRAVPSTCRVAGLAEAVDFILRTP